jgi:hypothetical protein
MCGSIPVCDNGMDQSVSNCPHLYEDATENG